MRLFFSLLGCAFCFCLSICFIVSVFDCVLVLLFVYSCCLCFVLFSFVCFLDVFSVVFFFDAKDRIRRCAGFSDLSFAIPRNYGLLVWLAKQKTE